MTRLHANAMLGYVVRYLSTRLGSVALRPKACLARGTCAYGLYLAGRLAVCCAAPIPEPSRCTAGHARGVERKAWPQRIGEEQALVLVRGWGRRRIMLAKKKNKSSRYSVSRDQERTARDCGIVALR